MLRDLFVTYRARNLRDASPATIRLWNIALKRFEEFLSRAPEISDLDDDTMAAFATWRCESVSPASANRDLASLLALWRWAHKKGLTTKWPDVPLCRVPQRAPIAWSQEEFNQLMGAARSAPGIIGKIPAKDWWPALLLTLFDTAERIGAVMALRWPSVDLGRGWIIFDAMTRKGRTADNVKRIAGDTTKALKNIRHGDDNVFPWPYAPTSLWTRYELLLAAAGLPNDRKHKFHAIRKTTASHYEAAGGNATSLLGHASRRNTERYLDPRIVNPTQPIDLLWRPE